METKNVIRLKKRCIFLFFLFILIEEVQSQIIDNPIYISREKDKETFQKIVNVNSIDFYISGEHFRHIASTQKKCAFKEKYKANVQIITVTALQQKADSIRKNQIKNHSNSIKILFNSDIFKKIYLIEDNKLYQVEWVEEVRN